jgi:hypothetical protein
VQFTANLCFQPCKPLSEVTASQGLKSFRSAHTILVIDPYRKDKVAVSAKWKDNVAGSAD